ncbi:hypothetical protein F2P56_014206 [Juglans regia]|uniref:Protein MIZU-KUSSEI 1-like n=2 Tax=Juglans regia TaxID=51240 RepID=A0A2I4G4D7_JUGRE|nr:protein MIZU-KUSSEI 1-like [Juglans regia]KAF5464098.1 hypothetical protein F2P56_014206 [Juglans regia]
MSGTPRALSSNGVTAVDCQKQVRSWRLLRSLMEFLIPSCNCSTFIEDQDIQQQQEEENNYLQNCYNSQYAFSTSSTTIVGTIFGFRHGKVRLCIQTSYNSTNSVLLLQLAVPTTTLAREMQGSILRIALESTATRQGFSSTTAGNSCSLLSMPVWKMYCNGRKVGFAVKRQPSKADMEALRVMSADHVVVGAGVISGKELQREDELMYLRANFERVCGSANSESFHLIDQDGSSTSSTGQELISIFFFRSRWS